MKDDTKRATVYFDAEIHRALRLKAAETERSLSELVNDAVKDDNQKILVKARTHGDAITHMIREYRSKHLERVENGDTAPLNSLIITDIFTSYRHVKDHALNIAEVLAGEK